MSSAPPAGTYADWIAGSLAHEIGHNVNCLHHGTGEEYRVLAGAPKEVFVACLQGQHSGDRDCIMAYNAADYFFKGKPVPSTGLDALLAQGKLIPYPDPLGTRRAFCSTTKGTGVGRQRRSRSGGLSGPNQDQELLKDAAMNRRPSFIFAAIALGIVLILGGGCRKTAADKGKGTGGSASGGEGQASGGSVETALRAHPLRRNFRQ